MWEFIKINEKMIITIVLQYYEQQIEIKGIIIFMILIIYSNYKKNYKIFIN